MGRQGCGCKSGFRLLWRGQANVKLHPEIVCYVMQTDDRRSIAAGKTEARKVEQKKTTEETKGCDSPRNTFPIDNYVREWRWIALCLKDVRCIHANGLQLLHDLLAQGIVANLGG